LVLCFRLDHGCTGTAGSVPNFKARLSPGLFVSSRERASQRAEIAFGEVQKQFFAKDRAVAELDSVVLAREAKTLRLREARLAKEAQDRASATGALLAKHA
jgi:hypothetical protein